MLWARGANSTPSQWSRRVCWAAMIRALVKNKKESTFKRRARQRHSGWFNVRLESLQMFVHPCSEQHFSKSPKAETTQMFTDRWIDKQNAVCHTMEYYSAFRGKEILTDVTTWVNLEDIMLCEVSQTQKNKYWWFHLYEVPRAVQSIEVASRMVVVRGWEEVGKMRHLLFDGYRVLFWDDENVLEMDGGDICIAMWICLMPLNCTLKDGWNSRYCVMSILLHFNKLWNSLFYIFMYLTFNLSRSLT